MASNTIVYAICNHVTGAAYIGQSRDFKARFLQHRSVLKRGCHTNAALQAGWNISGERAFGVVILERIQAPDPHSSAGYQWDWAQERRWLARARAGGGVLYNDQVGRGRSKQVA